VGGLLGGAAHHQLEVLVANAGGHDGRHMIEHLFQAEWHLLELEPPDSILEKSRMSLMIPSRAARPDGLCAPGALAIVEPLFEQ
jgi:hypothetical protein